MGLGESGSEETLCWALLGPVGLYRALAGSVKLCQAL